MATVPYNRKRTYGASPFTVPMLAMCLAAAGFAQQSEPERLIDAGQWKKARTLVEARLRQAPNDALANFLLSQIRNAFGDQTTPMMLAEKAAALDSRVAKYHRQVAEVLGVQAQHTGAIHQLFLARRFQKEIDTAIGLDPRDVQALRDLVEFYLLAPGIAGGDSKKAAATAERIGEIDAPEGFLAKARIAAFHKQTSEAEAALRSAVQAQPPSYRARIQLAQFYGSGENSDAAKAEAAAKQAIQLNRSRVEGYAILAEVCADRGDWNSLEAILTEASRQVPNDLLPYYRAAEHLLSGGRDPGRAERYLRAYLGQEPEGNEPAASEAHWKLGVALDGQGRQEGARAEWSLSRRMSKSAAPE